MRKQKQRFTAAANGNKYIIMDNIKNPSVRHGNDSYDNEWLAEREADRLYNK